MYKLFLLAVTIGGIVFANSLVNSPKFVKTSDQDNTQYCLTEDTSIDEFKIEAGRRRSKGDRKRRRGGSGLR